MSSVKELLRGDVIDGSGTANYIPKFIDTNTIGSSAIYESSGNIGIGTTTTTGKLQIGSAPTATGGANPTSFVIQRSDSSTPAFSIGLADIGSALPVSMISSNNRELFVGTRPDIDAANSQGIHFANGSHTAFYSGGSERMRIDSSGNVGIGLSNATEKLDIYQVNTGTDAAIRIYGNRFYNTSANVYTKYQINSSAVNNGTVYKWETGMEGDAGGQNFVFKSTSSNGTVERMTITRAGSFLVGTTSAINGIHQIQGSQSGAGLSVLTVYNSNSSDSSPAINAIKNASTTSSDARFIQFFAKSGQTPMGGIVGNGASNVQFASLSDEREKENITEISGSLDKIMQIQVSEFDWIKTGEHIKAGFVAQNVEKVFPEYVVENMSSEGEEARKGLTGGMSSGYIAHLTKAIQELAAEIESLKSQLNV